MKFKMASFHKIPTLIIIIIITACHMYKTKAEEGSVYLKHVIYSRSQQSLSEASSSVQNVSDICRQDLMNLFTGDPRIVQALDSFGKPTPGMLVGNTVWIGHFDECMNITDFRYCLVDMALNFTLDVNNTFALPINWGVCMPVSCSESDVQSSLEMLLDLLNVTWFEIKNVTGSAVHCTEKPYTDFNGGFIGTCVLFSLLSLLSVVGTGLDKRIARKQKRRPSLPPLPHGPAYGSDAGQSSYQRSRGVSVVYATVHRSRTKEDDENRLGQSSEPASNTRKTEDANDTESVYSCIDDLRSNTGRREDEGEGQRSNAGGYGAVGQTGGTYERHDVDSQVHGSSENTPLLGGSLHPDKKSDNKTNNGLLVEFLLCFSMSTNLPKILSTKQAPGGIPCLNGIRVISITWIILGHSFSMVMNAGLSENIYSAFRNYIQDFTLQVLLSTPFAVDTFFLLSGLLLSYLVLKKMRDNDGSLQWGWLYLHRYIRLTPVLAVIILIWMYLIPNMLQGPVSYRFDDRVTLCKSWWWTDLLYINNFVPPGLRQDCIAWSWYLANDMQFFIISPLLLIPMYRYGMKGMLGLFITCIASFITTAVLCYQNNFQLSIMSQGTIDTVTEPPSTEYMFANDEQGIIYNKPYCRIPPYLLGMALGYIMYDIGTKKIRLSPVFVAGGWSIAITLAMVIVYGLYDVNRGKVELSQPASIMYLTFSRFTWALAVVWVIFACHYGYGGVVNDILSWNFWIPLSRLTYSTYLIHPVIQSLYGYSQAVPIHWSVISLSFMFAASVLLAHCCALILCVLVEFPFGNMEKMLQKKLQAKHL